MNIKELLKYAHVAYIAELDIKVEEKAPISQIRYIVYRSENSILNRTITFYTVEYIKGNLKVFQFNFDKELEVKHNTLLYEVSNTEKLKIGITTKRRMIGASELAKIAMEQS